MDKVSGDRAPVIVTRKSSNAVVIMSLEDFDALEETAYRFRSPKNTRCLIESIARFENGKGKTNLKRILDSKIGPSDLCWADSSFAVHQFRRRRAWNG